MITVKRTTSDNQDFEKLVLKLDAFLAILDGEDHAFYAQFNKVYMLRLVQQPQICMFTLGICSLLILLKINRKVTGRRKGGEREVRAL